MSLDESTALLTPASTKKAMPPPPTKQERYIGGLILLLGVVILWTASNFITASLETGDGSYNKPFFITYLNTASFVVYLIPSWFKYRKPQSPTYQSIVTSPSADTLVVSPPPSSPRLSAAAPADNERISLNRRTASVVKTLPKLSVVETAKVAGWWAFFWFLANWALNVSLAWTSVASVTILSSTSGFFCLALGRVYGVESFSREKVFAAVASFVGVVLVTQSDNSLSASSAEPMYPDLPSHPILGDLAALLGAALYSVYVVYMKVKVGDEDRADSQLLLGFAGLFCIICLAPIIPILHWTGWETFELPPTKTAWIICGVNMCITLSSDYLYVLALLKTAPMMVTVGLSLTIPIALVASLFIPSAAASSITITSVLGAALVCAGFGIMGLQGLKESQSEDSEPEASYEHPDRHSLLRSESAEQV